MTPPCQQGRRESTKTFALVDARELRLAKAPNRAEGSRSGLGNGGGAPDVFEVSPAGEGPS
jgi:hypothetical protein